ncbi:MAG: hypothetical protein IPL67_12265 [Ignavibacteria bacterium]|nr:hypothetical protein [Ignavibacteria bacterium]
MEKKAGIWIDTQKAFIVTLDKSGHATKTILSQIETKVRIAGESKDFTRFGKQYFSPDEKKENKRKQEERDFFKAILKEITISDEIVLSIKAAHPIVVLLNVTEIRKFVVPLERSCQLTPLLVVFFITPL